MSAPQSQASETLGQAIASRMPPRTARARSTVAVKPIEKGTLLARLVAEVRGQVISGKLAADQQLPTEAVMAAEFGVSRPLLREALSELRAEGFIATINGRGSFVRHPTESDLVAAFARQLSVSSAAAAPDLTPDHLYEARTAIEASTAELAAGRATPESIAELGQLLQSMRDSHSDPAAYTASDVGFHVAVARASGNPLFPMLLSPIVSYIVAGVFESHGFDSAVRAGIADHERILAAITDKDPDRARQAMVEHLHASRKLFPEQVVSGRQRTTAAKSGQGRAGG
jgi:GntR family transcriptional regulator, transcriptional repressor for pyruvate dehydrogenase complex